MKTSGNIGDQTTVNLLWISVQLDMPIEKVKLIMDNYAASVGVIKPYYSLKEIIMAFREYDFEN